MTQAGAATELSEVRIAATHERVQVTAERRSDIEVDGGAHLARVGSSLTIEPKGHRLNVRVPLGTAVVIGTTSSRVTIKGDIGTAAITTESGKISVEAATSVDARTRSGRIDLGTIAGDCRIRSENGRVTIDSCVAADVSTTNGAIHLNAVGGPARVHCVNGRIRIDMSSAHDVFAETVNGRITISLPRGVRALQTSDDSDVAPGREGFDCVVTARSVSGRVSVSER